MCDELVVKQTQMINMYPAKDGILGFLRGSKNAVVDAPPVARVDPTGRRVLRGGAFSSEASRVRSATRDYYRPGDRYLVSGFRPARTYDLSP